MYLYAIEAVLDVNPVDDDPAARPIPSAKGVGIIGHCRARHGPEAGGVAP